MKLVVFGVTGASGLQVAQQAVAASHEVVAFARNPDALPASLRDRVTVVKGDVTDAAQVASAVRGAGAVVSCLGTKPWKHVDVCSAGMRAIEAAMVEAGVKRVIVMSSIGVGDSKIAGIVGAIAGRLLAKSFRDKGVMERELAATALEWIVVRPARLTDGAATGRWRVADDDSVTTGKISRADTAAFMLAQLTSTEWVRRYPRLAY